MDDRCAICGTDFLGACGRPRCPRVSNTAPRDGERLQSEQIIRDWDEYRTEDDSWYGLNRKMARELYAALRDARRQIEKLTAEYEADKRKVATAVIVFQEAIKKCLSPDTDDRAQGGEK